MAKKVHLSLDIHSSVLCISEDGEGTEVLQVIIPRERRVFYLKYTTALFAEKKKKKNTTRWGKGRGEQKAQLPPSVPHTCVS